MASAFVHRHFLCTYGLTPSVKDHHFEPNCTLKKRYDQNKTEMYDAREASLQFETRI